MIRQCVLLLLLIWVSVGTVEAACVHHPQRSSPVRRQFLRQAGFPHGRPGYVVDHIVPLCLGGPDALTNLQWQRVTDARRKDRQERAACARACRRQTP